MARCLTPFRKKDSTDDLPCGRCVNCLKKRASNWSIRLLKEAERSCSAFFVTLTYKNEAVPLSGNSYMTLHKPDVQGFIKKLRHHHGTRIKYYAVGEYGSDTMRPHYHIIFFNLEWDFPDLGPKGILFDYEKDTHPILQVWGNGNVHVGRVTDASVGYTLKYISKPYRIPLHQRDDRQKEFSLMSKKLGDNYLTKQKIAWHRKDLYERCYIPLPDGKKAPMPRYFKEKIYTHAQKAKIALRNEEKDLIELQKATPEELLQKELINSEKTAKWLRNQNKDPILHGL